MKTKALSLLTVSAKNTVTCVNAQREPRRIYDQEIHHDPFAIDFYAGRFCVYYFARSQIDERGFLALQIKKAARVILK